MRFLAESEDQPVQQNQQRFPAELEDQPEQRNRILADLTVNQQLQQNLVGSQAIQLDGTAINDSRIIDFNADSSLPSIIDVPRIFRMVPSQHHMRRNSVSYSADDEHYEEGYPVFRFGYSITKEGSDSDELYVYSYGIQEGSRDMYSLSDPNLSPSENVIILVYQNLSKIKLRSLVFRMLTLPF